MTPHDIENQIHIAWSSSELTDAQTAANVYDSPPDWAIFRWNREFEHKNLILGTSYIYSSSGSSVVSLFSLTNGALVPAATITGNLGLFVTGAQGQLIPSTGNGTDNYFELNAQNNIIPV